MSRLKVGMFISLGILLLTLLVVLWVGVRSYDGHCMSFEPPRRPCTLLQFLIPYVLVLVLFSAVGKPMLTLVVLVAVIVPPIGGYLVDRRRLNSTTTQTLGD
jgi:hypothetical protein